MYLMVKPTWLARSENRIYAFKLAQYCKKNRSNQLKHFTVCRKELSGSKLLNSRKSVTWSAVPYAPFLGSGPVGDDDLWYHHILVTLCSVFLSVSIPPRPLSWPSQLAPGLPAGSRALPAGSSWLQGPPGWLQAPTSSPMWWYHRSSSPTGLLPPYYKTK